MTVPPDVSEWMPEEYPQLTAALIPYTTSPNPRPDPFLHVTENGWLFIEVGNVRIAIPDQEEWDKLTIMVSALWEQYRTVQEIMAAMTMHPNPPFPTPTFVDDTSPDGGPEEGETDEPSDPDRGEPGGPAPLVDQP